MSEKLTAAVIKEAVRRGASFERVTEFRPAGGPGNKVFPPTYEGGQYATETRYINGKEVPCVLMDSVPSQANRMEEALLDANDRGEISLPLISVNFSDEEAVPLHRITALEAPHRASDAIIRDSYLDGKPFRKSDLGRALNDISMKNATPLFKMCPTALAYGMWDSTGERGAMGSRFQRMVVSEIFGVNAVQGRGTSSRIDPLQIRKEAAKVYHANTDLGWTLDESEAVKDSKGKPCLYTRDSKKDKLAGQPSKINHGNIPPKIEDRGFTIEKAVQSTVITLSGMRKLRFPLVGDPCNPVIDDLARTVLVAIGLCGATMANEIGCDLRSRCLLVPTEPFVWELVGRPGEPVRSFDLRSEDAAALLNETVDEAKKAGLPWLSDIVLKPSAKLVELYRRSRQLDLGIKEED